ncbi:hypothetical protein ACPCIR_05850 [Mycobacterium sp. NPDC051198]
MEVLVIAIVVVVLMWVAAVWLGFRAKQQVAVDVPAAPDEVARIVRDHFGSVTWKPVNGKGTINYRSRGFGVGSMVLKNPTISIDLSALEGGGTRAEVWMSAWETKGGIVGSADRVVLKKRSLVAKLLAV